MNAINLLKAQIAPYSGADKRHHAHGVNDQIPHGRWSDAGRRSHVLAGRARCE
jgi:hypothetical protein